MAWRPMGLRASAPTPPGTASQVDWRLLPATFRSALGAPQIDLRPRSPAASSMAACFWPPSVRAVSASATTSAGRDLIAPMCLLTDVGLISATV
jgi:hypothetical protein